MWRVLAVAALLWPSRLSGVLDGPPLDTRLEAVTLGLIVPVLVWAYPAFLRGAIPRVLIVGILTLKIGAALTLQQEGWCLTFAPSKPMVRDSTGKPHAWDPRADWLSPDPECSAVMTRAYFDTLQLPAWFFNLPPPDDTPHRRGYQVGEIPVHVGLSGFVTAARGGTLAIETTPAMAATMLVDGRWVAATRAGRHEATLAAGTHTIRLDAALHTREWRIIPAWNGAAMGSLGFPETTIRAPSRLDRAVRPFANWIAAALIASLIIWWLISFVTWIGASSVLIWSAASAAAIAIVAVQFPAQAAWYTAAVILLPLLIETRPRLMNARGVLLLIGVPWLAYVAATTAEQVGRWTLYGVGNDNFQFQRFAYRIFMQQYWLEGGQVTFWNQPLFRWIAGGLHMVFGDSSVGQAYWDAAAIVIIAMFAYKATAARWGFSWGVAGATVPLLMFLLGPTREFVGFGLSEISSAGFISLAALFAMRGRARDGLIAGVLATLGFFTRLNNFPMAVAVAMFALPITLPVRAVWQMKRWPAPRWRVAVATLAALAIGLTLFAARTWYYTGEFSVFYGTQREHLSVWRSGMPLRAAIDSMAGSVMMVLTASDPPRLAWHAVPLLAAAVIAFAALVGVPGVREAPLPVVLMFVAGCSSALVTRGWAYEGRFSIHLFGAAGALCAWGFAASIAGLRRRFMYSRGESRRRSELAPRA